MRWTEEEIQYLKNNFHNHSNENLGEELKRTKNAIFNKAREIGLKKSKEYISHINSERVNSTWTEEEIIFLTENYNNIINKKLAILLDKSTESIGNMACRLNLTNSKRIRKYSKDYLLRETKKYKNKQEFRYCDPNLHAYAHREGYIEDCSKHMKKISYSTPQLICKYIFDILVGYECEYNTRKIIKPYELDLYYPNHKLAIEYNGKHWHVENDNTELKIKMCEELGINLIVIKENNLETPDFVGYVKIILKEIINNIEIISNSLNREVSSDFIRSVYISPDVIFNDVMHIDEIYNITNICNKYTEYSLFIKENKKLYSKLHRYKQLNRFTSHMNKRIKWDIYKAEKIIHICKNITDLYTNHSGCYFYIKRNKLDFLLNKLK